MIGNSCQQTQPICSRFPYLFQIYRNLNGNENVVVINISGTSIMTKNEHLNQGFKHFAAGDYESAIKALKAALELDPQFDLALNALAEVYNKKGAIDTAIEYALRLVEINPEDPLAHTALSRLYVQKGMIREAENEMAISNQLNLK